MQTLPLLLYLWERDVDDDVFHRAKFSPCASACCALDTVAHKSAVVTCRLPATEMAVLAETRYHARDTLCLPATLQRHVYCLVHRSHVLRCSHCCWAPGEWCLWAGFRENQVRAKCRGRLRRTRVRRASVMFLTRGDSGLCCDAASAPAHLLCARETRLGGGDCSSGIAVLSASGRDTLHEPLLCLLPRPTAWAQARACCRSTADCLSHHRTLRSL